MIFLKKETNHVQHAFLRGLEFKLPTWRPGVIYAMITQLFPISRPPLLLLLLLGRLKSIMFILPKVLYIEIDSSLG